METTSNSEIFDVGVTKTRDGRIRKTGRQRENNGELTQISDTPLGLEIKNGPGTRLKE